MAEVLGPDGHPIPEVQGVVEAKIQPIKASDLRFGNLGKAAVVAVGAALRFPQFAKPPDIMPGTQARRFDGSIVEGTGVPTPETVEVTDETLTNARDAAERAMAVKSTLTTEGLQLAMAVTEYGDGSPRNPLAKAPARMTAIAVIASASRMPEVNSASVDLLNMAYAVIHYGNKERQS